MAWPVSAGGIAGLSLEWMDGDGLFTDLPEKDNEAVNPEREPDHGALNRLQGAESRRT
ncbi:hypothetical protein GCM10009116_03570 [Brevundimonas basaltis]